MEGAASFAARNKLRTRLAPIPTNIWSNSEPDKVFRDYFKYANTYKICWLKTRVIDVSAVSVPRECHLGSTGTLVYDQKEHDSLMGDIKFGNWRLVNHGSHHPATISSSCRYHNFPLRNTAEVSEPDAKKKGTHASPARALARRVLPTPGGPVISEKLSHWKDKTLVDKFKFQYA